MYLTKNMVGNKILHKRVLGILFGYVTIFLTVLIIAHYFLPEGFLRGNTVGGNLNFSNNIYISAIQIFLFNLISTCCIIVGSIFTKRKNENEAYISTGIQTLFILCIINALVLGTNSFGTPLENASLSNKIIGILNIFHAAALWEILGLILITAVFSFDKSLVMTTGKITISRNIRSIHFTKQEIFVMLLGIILMIVGAFIESYAILE